jgi:hypothetical protein
MGRSRAIREEMAKPHYRVKARACGPVLSPFRQRQPYPQQREDPREPAPQADQETRRPQRQMARPAGDQAVEHEHGEGHGHEYAAQQEQGGQGRDRAGRDELGQEGEEEQGELGVEEVEQDGLGDDVPAALFTRVRHFRPGFPQYSCGIPVGTTT